MRMHFSFMGTKIFDGGLIAKEPLLVILLESYKSIYYPWIIELCRDI